LSEAWDKQENQKADSSANSGLSGAMQLARNSVFPPNTFKIDAFGANIIQIRDENAGFGKVAGKKIPGTGARYSNRIFPNN